MIKEKHEKGSDSVKEEPGSSNKETGNNELLVKKEEDPLTSAGSNCAIKKEPGRPLTKNGGVIGSTNTGSLHTNIEIKSENEENSSSRDNIPTTLKTEEPTDNDLTSNTFGLNLPASTPQHPPSSDGVQPLVSNVINKQSSNIEVHYMQQQSQIFVFSTTWANSGANEVMQGHYPSIIAYHCAQPGTKKYLEKNPLKLTQFNRQNPNQWLNNLAIMKSKGCVRPGMVPKNQSIDNFLGGDSLDDMVSLRDNDLPWEQKNNHNLDNLDNVSNGLADVLPDMNACSPSLGNVQPSLQGVKVPDENLTPQQRQHREEKLANIRKMQQMLFPENHSIDAPPDPSRPFGITRHMSTGQSPTSQDSPSAPRLNHSNPGTPQSSHMSPSVTNSNNETNSNHQSTG